MIVFLFLRASLAPPGLVARSVLPAAARGPLLGPGPCRARARCATAAFMAKSEEEKRGERGVNGPAIDRNG